VGLQPLFQKIGSIATLKNSLESPTRPAFFRPRYNIAPSQQVPVIYNENGTRVLKEIHWGLVPAWAQDRSIGQQMINARAETLMEKPSLKYLVGSRHCLVPADGFTSGGETEAARFQCGSASRPKNRSPSLVSGTSGEILPRASRFTRSRLSPRMRTRSSAAYTTACPVILDRLGGEQWLDQLFGTRQLSLAAFLRPIPSERIEMHDVSPRVNSPENDGPECIEAVTERKTSRLPLFD
jgi:putative SOS response-associated peptidase YedK